MTSRRSVQSAAPTASPTVRTDRGIEHRPSRSDANRATTPNPTNAGHGSAEIGPGDEPEQSAHRQRDDQDDDVQGELVVRSEQRHDELLGARRLEVDDQAADRHDERRRSAEQAREDLADRDRHGDRDRAGDKERPAAGRRGRGLDRVAAGTSVMDV